jgi:hypothetical protein
MSMRAPNATLHTASGAHALDLRLAGRWPQRLRGLLLRPPLASPWSAVAQPKPVCQGLLLWPCHSVHSIGLGYALDLAYLVRQGKGWAVCHLARLPPWSASAHWASQATLELPQGSIEAFGLALGNRLECPNA